MPECSMSSPVGPIYLHSDGVGIDRVGWHAATRQHDDPVLAQARALLDDYFNGQTRDFDIPLSLKGSAFSQKFARALCAIPFGETKTYGELATELGVSAQAIGQACGANPIPVIVPCHRVLGAENLGGYSGQGGVETKVWLLKHEGAAGLLI